MPANRRRPAIEEARGLTALVGALREDGDTLDADSVAARLGITPAHAQHLLDLLTQAGGDSYASALPLAADSDDSVTLVSPFANTVRGRSVRLTPAEAKALEAAFDAMGLAETDDLRMRIKAAYWPKQGEEREMASLLTAQETTDGYDRLAQLARAILAGKRVEFDYKPVEVAAPGARRRTAPLHRRHVGPVGLRHEGDKWYLDAYDLDRRADRRFRVDRIDRLILAEEGWQRSADCAADDNRMVRLTFTDPALLDLFDWHGLHVLAHRKDGIECEIPWYQGGQWLPRHIAACGGGVTVNDAELAGKTASYAADLREQGLGV